MCQPDGWRRQAEFWKKANETEGTEICSSGLTKNENLRQTLQTYPTGALGRAIPMIKGEMEIDQRMELSFK